MLVFISDVAIKQAVNGMYFYDEQDANSRDWGDPLIKKPQRLPDVGERGPSTRTQVLLESTEGGHGVREAAESGA
eukprot:1823011-Pyramimonas_sp.AAC.2